MQFVKGGPDIPEHLLQAQQDGRVIFFCGAGISYPADLPGFAGLVDKLYSRLEITPDPVQAAAIKAKRYDTAVGLLEANFVGGRQAVREKIAEILEPDLSVPYATATHDALLTLGESRDRRTRLITTNFDRLFEHVILNGHHSVERFEAPLLPVPKRRWDGLVYLHGLLPEDPAGDNLDNLVVSSGDFGLAYLTERWAARFVSEVLRNFVVCFVGYSIDDPVLRYMMDALAADQLLGESSPEMFAFGIYSKGKEGESSNKWRAKNVTPILYRAHRRHAYLHRTLRAWADTYRDGTRGKERIVIEYAMAHPDTATGQDDFVSRMVWALSDPSGVPAMRFAELDPVPSLDWLKPLSEEGFQHEDLLRFGVPPKASVDKNLAFSLTRRPAPYDLAPKMALANTGVRDTRYDNVMRQLARWLIRHLNNPDLLLRLVKQGGKLHGEMATLIAHRVDELAKLEHSGMLEELDRIRNNAPDAVPDARMRTLWGLLLAERVKLAGQNLDLYGWWRRFERDGLTTSLRLELREMLTPRVSLREPFQWSFGNDEDEEKPEHIRQLVHWDIVLSANHVHAKLQDGVENEHWVAALPALLPEFTGILRDVLDLMRELDGATDRSDLSYSSQPSISKHSQNSAFRDWTALIELNRDAWLATAQESPERARRVAEAWSQIPYPLFRRLAFFAAAQDAIVPCSQGLEWLLADDNRWLWSIETQRETMRLLVALAPHLDEDDLARLERTTLAGPPREMYRADIEEARWTEIQDNDIWLRLGKISGAGAKLHAAARERLDGLSAKYPNWQVAEDERDEFPTWTSDGNELLVYVTTPRDQDELIGWLRENPEPNEWRPDYWRERCRDDFDDAAFVLTALAEEGTWLTGRWREALYAWSEESLTERSWRMMAPVMADVPEATLQELSHPVSSWLEKLSRNFEDQEETFLSLCDRVLALEYDVEDEMDDDPVGRAINHPVGNVTEALIHWWHRSDLKDGQRLADEPRERFSRICDTHAAKFRHGRVLLAAHLISLFRVDRQWAAQFMLPLFEWGNSEAEARLAWEGFLWSPRLYRPLMEVLKPAFLDTANHYARLGRHNQQYAALLTFVGLDPSDVFQNHELAFAMQALPKEALEHAAETLFRAVNGAGDQRADYWKNRASQYVKSIWPKTPDAISESVSESFSQACVAAGDAFPEALGQIHSWLQPLQFPDRIAYDLHQTNQIAQFPEQALELLDQIFRDEAQGSFPELGECLSAIRATQPELEYDHRFQRLLAILQANGGDLE